MHMAWFTYSLLTAALLLLFAWQYRKSVRQRQRLSLCILVNGTRGKSSTTRLIAAGLRAGLAIPVLGKTTGTQARWLFPDGTEDLVSRHSPPNIREMAAGLALAERLGAKVYVAECMAITPEYQKVIERRWMRSDIVIITNIRPDHEDVLGEGLSSVAAALAASLPEKGLLVTTPQAAALLRSVCAFPCERVRVAEPDLGSQWAMKFSEPVIQENLSLALTACALAGVPPETAVTGMIAAATDPGSVEVRRLCSHGRPVTFVGAFAANDPVSTLLIAREHPPRAEAARGLWLHARADRRRRTLSLCAALQSLAPDFVIFSGDADFLRKQWQGSPPRLGMFSLPLRSAGELEGVLGQLPPGPLWILGAGNTKGMMPQLMGGEKVCQRLS